MLTSIAVEVKDTPTHKDIPSSRVSTQAPRCDVNDSSRPPVSTKASQGASRPICRTYASDNGQRPGIERTTPSKETGNSESTGQASFVASTPKKEDKDSKTASLFLENAMIHSGGMKTTGKFDRCDLSSFEMCHTERHA